MILLSLEEEKVEPTINSIFLSEQHCHFFRVIEIQLQINRIVECLLRFDFWNVVIKVEYQSAAFADDIYAVYYHSGLVLPHL